MLLPGLFAAATNDPLLLEGNEASTSLEFLPPTRRSPPLVAPAQFAALAAAAPFPGLADGAAHAYLNFENVTGSGVPPVHDVYVGRKGETGRYAGALPFFGVAESSIPDTRHSGSGQSYVLDISAIAHALEEEPGWDPAQLEVTVRPRRAPRPGSNVRIGRISLYVKSRPIRRTGPAPCPFTGWRKARLRPRRASRTASVSRST